MADLVACLSTGKGTWTEVKKLIHNQDWENIYLVTNDFGKDKFTADKELKFILVDVNSGMDSMKKIIMDALQEKVKTEVAVNFISGSGKEHMALLSALFKLGVGIRFIIPTDSDVKEL
tara:strand:+ start:115 stop:468 length:354 start_codon:yes stop_codon:yes gene_type:complete